MADIREIIEFIDNYLEAAGKSYTTPVEINPLLESAGLLNDSPHRPGKPLRDKLRDRLIPHAYQLGGKGGRWAIPHSSAESKLNENKYEIKRIAPKKAPHEYRLPEELEDTESLFEGLKRKITINAYERNKEARLKCINHYGEDCVICGFNFEKTYGEAVKGLIHVHHLRKFSEIGEEYEVDPVNDLRPVCPNCHAVIHWDRNKPPYRIKEVKAFVRRKRFKPKKNNGVTS